LTQKILTGKRVKFSRRSKTDCI